MRGVTYVPRLPKARHYSQHEQLLFPDNTVRGSVLIIATTRKRNDRELLPHLGSSKNMDAARAFTNHWPLFFIVTRSSIYFVTTFSSYDCKRYTKIHLFRLRRICANTKAHIASRLRAIVNLNTNKHEFYSCGYVAINLHRPINSCYRHNHDKQLLHLYEHRPEFILRYL